jgi:hypothetical protein
VQRAMSTRSTRWAAIIVTVGVYLVATVVARRRGYSGLGGRTLVRCRAGHVFSTLWVPGVSFKALRLGWYRAQYCPVGRHWTMVRPIKDQSLSAAEREIARSTRDLPLI